LAAFRGRPEERDASEQADGESVGDAVVDAAQPHPQRVDSEAQAGGDRLDRPPAEPYVDVGLLVAGVEQAKADGPLHEQVRVAVRDGGVGGR
jgi:hypothetical protein